MSAAEVVEVIKQMAEQVSRANELSEQAIAAAQQELRDTKERFATQIQKVNDTAERQLESLEYARRTAEAMESIAASLSRRTS